MSKLQSWTVTLCSLAALAISACVSEPEADARVRRSTVEILSNKWPSSGAAGAGFFIEPHHIATAAHVLDGFMSGHWEPVIYAYDHRGSLVFGDVIRYDPDRDFAVVSLSPDLDVPALEPAGPIAFEAPVRYGGHRYTIDESGLHSGIAFEQGTFFHQSDDSSDFRGTVWQGMSGGPLFDAGTGTAIGMIVEWRKQGFNRAVPIKVLRSDEGSNAVISVSSALLPLGMTPFDDSPPDNHVSLPLPFRAFANAVQVQRGALYDSVFSRYASAPREAFVLDGTWAAEGCELLNGAKCACPASPAQGAPRLAAPEPNADILSALSEGHDLVYGIEGAVVVRDKRKKSARIPSLIKKDRLHRDLAFRGLKEPNLYGRIYFRDKGVFTAFTGKKHPDQTYTDKQDRTWVMRVWPLQSTDYVIVSLARDLKDSHLVLMQAVPQAYEKGGVEQLKFVANYAYACAPAN